MCIAVCIAMCTAAGAAMSTGVGTALCVFPCLPPWYLPYVVSWDSAAVCTALCNALSNAKCATVCMHLWGGEYLLWCVCGRQEGKGGRRGGVEWREGREGPLCWWGLNTGARWCPQRGDGPRLHETASPYQRQGAQRHHLRSPPPPPQHTLTTRDKEHSTIIYESAQPDTPLLRLAWNRQVGRGGRGGGGCCLTVLYCHCGVLLRLAWNKQVGRCVCVGGGGGDAAPPCSAIVI